MNAQADNLRRSKDALREALREAGAAFKGTAVGCPFHDDKHPSGNLYAKDGIWRFKCMTSTCGFCGDVFDVRARFKGVAVEDLLRELGPAKEQHHKATVYATVEKLAENIRDREAVYQYANPDTKKIEAVVIRRPDGDGGKKFLQARPDGDGFIFAGPIKPWPIYNRTRLRTTDRVIVVEGEKCVHALADIGIVATTSLGGAGKSDCADWTPLAGKTIYLWPDNDPPNESGRRNGVEHMTGVATCLDRLEPHCKIFLIDPDELMIAPKGDVVEYLRDYGGDTDDSRRTAIEAVLNLASSIGASGEVEAILEDEIAGRRKAISFPWPELTRMACALLPGTITCLCADPGATKSFLLLEATSHWMQGGVKAATYMLEEDRAYHLRRALAQKDCNGELTQPEWVTRNAEDARAAMRTHRDYLDALGKYLYAAPDKDLRLAELSEWVKDRAKSGCRVIALDPITAAATSDRPWEDDRKFLMDVKQTAREFGCSIFLVTHPRKGKRASMPDLNDLAGGAAYQRFSQTVLWLLVHENKRCRMKHPLAGMDYDGVMNRSIKIVKARNGRGAGCEVAFSFDAKTLCLAEQGIVIRQSKKVEAQNESVESD